MQGKELLYGAATVGNGTQGSNLAGVKYANLISR
jgi:hypothetical protein